MRHPIMLYEMFFFWRFLFVFFKKLLQKKQIKPPKKMTKAQANLLLELAWSQDTITRRDVIESLRVSNDRARNYLLRKMKNAGFLRFQY